MSIKSIAVPVGRRRPAPVSAASPAPEHVDVEEVVPRRPARNPAETHRYRIGQRLRIVGSGRYWGRVGGECKVVALMPHESGPFLYRVRTDNENFERVVSGADLSALNADSDPQEGP